MRLFLCPRPVLYFRSSSVTVIYLPLSCSFFFFFFSNLTIQSALCLCLPPSNSPAPLFYNISVLTELVSTLLDTQSVLSLDFICPLCLCGYFFFLKTCSVSDWISVLSSFPCVPLWLLIKSQWSRRSDRRKHIPQCISARQRGEGQMDSIQDSF